MTMLASDAAAHSTAASSAASIGAATLMDESARSLNAIAAEVGDYSWRFIEDTTSTIGAITHAQSPTDAFGTLTAFNKRSGELYVEHITRIASMYAEAAHQQTLAFQSILMPLATLPFGISPR